MSYPHNVISCVVDEAPLFQVQAWLFLHALSKLVNPDDTRIILNHCAPLHDLLRDKAAQTGAQLHSVARYGTGPAAYCNKLQQLDNVIASGAQYAVMCDTDMGFLIDPCTLARAGRVRAKPVDLGNPPAGVIRKIFDLAGFAAAPLDVVPEFQEAGRTERTHRFNCNGGLYILPVEMLRRLAPVWRKYAAFCLEQQALLGDAAIHCDQISFALAMEALELPFAPLEAAHNFPLHFAKEAYGQHREIRPQILHYHRRMAPGGVIKSPGVPNVRARVELFNMLVADGRVSEDFRKMLADAEMEVPA